MLHTKKIALVDCNSFYVSCERLFKPHILKKPVIVLSNNDGNVIRLSVPTLTEERRVELVKNVHKIIEDGRVSIRNIRRDSNNALKELEKNNELSEDNLKRALDNVQESTDEYIKIFNDMQDNKEKEIME